MFIAADNTEAMSEKRPVQRVGRAFKLKRSKDRAGTDVRGGAKWSIPPGPRVFKGLTLFFKGNFVIKQTDNNN